jgi:hypothetical protein
MWDVAARYAGEFNGFKIAAAAAYNEVSACNNFNGLCAPGAFAGGYNNLGPLDADYFQAGLYIEHVPTGVFGLVNYGKYDDNTPQQFGFAAVPEQDTWYFKAGLRERWTPLGHTVLYGEYETVSDAFAVESGDFRLWGLGVVQEIDAAAMSLWVSYRNIEADDHSAAAQAAFGSSQADFQYIKGGALINF